MNKQKICIIGGSLTGLVTAICLSKLNFEIDLITGDYKKNLKSSRTIAISQNNFNFLKKLNISKTLKKEFWPSSIMKLYGEEKGTKFSKIFELNNNKKENKILFTIENSKLVSLMNKKIKKIKSISIIKSKKILDIKNSGILKSIKITNNNFKYNLIIICAGNNSTLVKKLFKNQTIENSYQERSITGILGHASLNNNVARQFFLNNEILAMLPISNKKTSIVLSIKNGIKCDDLYYKEKIKFYAKNYLTKIKFTSNIEYKDLNFMIRKKYYKDRILLFGDALHVIHPFVGQGFNMILRDLVNLEKVLNKKLNLGLDAGSIDVLSEFSSKTKASNFAFSISIDLLKNYFSINNKYFKKVRNNIFKITDKNNFIKNIFFNIANKGFDF